MAIILSEVGGIGAAQSLGAKLIAVISAPITLERGTVCVGASIGVALYPDHRSTSDQVLACADGAMYVPKSRGNGVCLASDLDEVTAVG